MIKRLLQTALLAIIVVAMPGTHWPAFAAQHGQSPQAVDADQAYMALLNTSEQIGTGLVSAYRKGDSVLLAIPKHLFGRLLFWSAEVVSYPAKAVNAGGNILGTAVVTLERNGTRILIRNRAPGYTKLAGPTERHRPGHADMKISPIQRSVDEATNAPVVAALKIAAEAKDGTVLVDVGPVFSRDFDTLSARSQIAKAGVVPQTVDPNRSFVSAVNVFPNNITIRSQLTFLGVDASAPARLLEHAPEINTPTHAILMAWQNLVAGSTRLNPITHKPVFSHGFIARYNVSTIYQYDQARPMSTSETWGVSGFAERFVGTPENANQIEHLSISTILQAVLGEPLLVLNAIEEEKLLIEGADSAEAHADMALNRAIHDIFLPLLDDDLNKSVEALRAELKRE